MKNYRPSGPARETADQADRADGRGLVQGRWSVSIRSIRVIRGLSCSANWELIRPVQVFCYGSG